MKLTIANDRDPLVLERIAPVPACGMHQLPLEVFNTWNLRPVRFIEGANSRDQEV